MGNNRVAFWLIIFIAIVVTPIAVFADGEDLFAEIEHIIIEKQGENTIQIRSMLAIKNLSDIEIISSVDNPVVSFTIPDQAMHVLVFVRGEEIPHTIIGDKLIIDYSWPPDRTAELSIQYFMAIEDAKLDFSYQRDFPVAVLNILIPSSIGIGVQSSSIADSGVMSMGQNTYRVYSTGEIAANEKLSAVLVDTEGEGDTNALEGSGNVNRIDEGYDGFHNPGHIRFWEGSPFSALPPHLATAIFVLILTFAAGNYIHKWRKEEHELKLRQKQQDDDVFIRLYKEESILKKKLAELQIKFDNKEVSEEDFENRKQVLKKKLIAVKLKIKEFTE